MKQILMVLALIVGFLCPSFAQTDAKAKAILTEVGKKYRSYNIIKTDFTFTLDNPQAKVKETQQGTLIVKSSANKYKVTMTEQELFSDGKSQWTYLKDDKEVQVTDVDNSSDAINPAKIFTLYESGYKYLFVSEKKVSTKIYQTIDLTPTDIKKSIFKVRLTIDKVAKQITNVLIFDKSGNKYTYNIKTFVPNVKVAESIFAFDAKKYPGVEVVDLR
ncbi:MAG: outer membrane lipoprotein carrier protein LolA [Pedobacter sp.]|nr:MAG: outer membrane lipoprotein carrier protein LolA [Pedobacter sp.]